MSTLRAQVGAFPSSKGTILVLSSNLCTSASVSEILGRAGYIVDMVGEGRTRIECSSVCFLPADQGNKAHRHQVPYLDVM